MAMVFGERVSKILDIRSQVGAAVGTAMNNRKTDEVLLAGIYREQQETNRLLRKLAGEPEPG